MYQKNIPSRILIPIGIQPATVAALERDAATSKDGPECRLTLPVNSLPTHRKVSLYQILSLPFNYVKNIHTNILDIQFDNYRVEFE